MSTHTIKREGGCLELYEQGDGRVLVSLKSATPNGALTALSVPLTDLRRLIDQIHDDQETPMTAEATTAYTAEDFANARFAEHRDGRISARLEVGIAPWLIKKYGWFTDADMAGEGWHPVREHDEGALSDKWKAGYDKGRASGYWSGYEDAMAEVKRWSDTPDPYSPEALEAAWEQAEHGGDLPRPGDLVILREDQGSVQHYRIAMASARVGLALLPWRILRRAPRPKTEAEKLAHAIRECDRNPALASLPHPVVAVLAEDLVRAGVRVVDGDDQ